MAQLRASERRRDHRPSLDVDRNYNLLREAQDVREAIEDAAPSQCHTARGIYILCCSTGKAFPASCKRWTCPTCANRNRHLAFLVIEAGLCIAFEERLSARYLVLTSPGDGMDPTGVQSAWNRLRGRLAHGGHYESYAATVEVKGGRPHLNVVTVGGRAIWQKALCEIAEQVGFGRVASIKSVTPSSRDAGRLAQYILKGAVEAVRWARRCGIRVFRPVRLSKLWRPFGLTEARRRLREACGLPTAKGPFIRVRFSGQKLKVIGQEVIDPGGGFR